MSTEAYKDVRLVLGDPDPKFGKIVSSAVFPLGLRDISVCGDGECVRQSTAATVDVVACDTNLPQLDFKAFAQDIRHGKVGANPFVVLIATAGDAEEAKTARILESGVDELMVKPVHPLLLIRRIGALAKERKPFVMTPGYVGPSRRAERRNDGSDDAVVAVPNTLRAKVVEKQNREAVGALVESGRSSLDEEKARSGIAVIARLTRRLVDLEVGAAPVDEVRRVLRELARMALAVATEHRNADATRHIAPIADRLAMLALRAEPAPTRPAKVEIDLLARLSAAAQLAFAAESQASGAVPEIVAVVDGYLARS